MDARDQSPAQNEVTRLLNAATTGQSQAADQLVPLLYDELRRIAASKLARERPGHTLQATALVHEAYLRLLGGNNEWRNRAHFFAAAAEAMRRILVDNARRKHSLKRGGDFERIDWTDLNVAVEADDDRLILVHEALEKLEAKDQNAAQLVKLRFFVGLTGQQAAETLGIPERSANRLWAYARAWLLKEIQRDP